MPTGPRLVPSSSKHVPPETLVTFDDVFVGTAKGAAMDGLGTRLGWVTTNQSRGSLVNFYTRWRHLL